ncbi:WD repeat-containing protein 60 [Globodera pallida]|nr:WD repeat-containing protein 60 [Globodera pallida]
MEEAQNEHQQITKTVKNEAAAVDEEHDEEEEDPAKSSVLLRRVAEGKLRAKETADAGGAALIVRREVNFVDENGAAQTEQLGAERWSSEMFRPQLGGEEHEAGMTAKAAHLMDFFMELAGKREGRAQACTQMPEAGLAVATQTERTESESKSTQQTQWTDESVFSNSNGQQRHLAEEEGGKHGQNWQQRRRLNTFLKAVEHLVSGIGALADTSPDKSILQHNSNLEFSSRFSTFSLSNSALFKEGRLCAMTVKDPHTISVAIFVPKSDDVRLNRKSFIAEFPLESPEIHPLRLESEWKLGEEEQFNSVWTWFLRLLRCEQEVVAFRYSSDNFSAAFAGLKDGSVVAWDLHAEERPFASLVDAGGGSSAPASASKGPFVLVPCFDTAFSSLIDAKDDESRQMGTSKHRPPIRSSTDDVEMPSSIVALEVLSGEVKAPGVLAQLVTLYESGTVRWWTALDNPPNLQQPFQWPSDAAAGDLDGSYVTREGGGQIKLVQLFTTTRCFGGRKKIGEFCTCMAFLPPMATNLSNSRQSSKVLVGSSAGRIVSVGRGENECVHYSSGGIDRGIEPEEITGIRTCPLKENIFAIITSRRLLFYDQNIRSPILIHSLSNRILSPTLFEWSPSNRASTPFFTVHDGEVLTLWKYKKDTKRLQSFECDLKGEINAKIRATLTWTDQMDSSFVAFLLSDDQVQIHCLERTNSTDAMQFIETLKVENAV